MFVGCRCSSCGAAVTLAFGAAIAGPAVCRTSDCHDTAQDLATTSPISAPAGGTLVTSTNGDPVVIYQAPLVTRDIAGASTLADRPWT